MSTATPTGFRPAPTQLGLSDSDRSAHDESTYVRRPLAPQAAAEHDRTKDPLPPRPRGPHPYLVGAVA